MRCLSEAVDLLSIDSAISIHYNNQGTEGGGERQKPRQRKEKHYSASLSDGYMTTAQLSPEGSGVRLKLIENFKQL